MSTEYFYIKESTKELFDLGNGGHYYDLYELILKKIRSFQKSGTSIDVVKEKLKPYILEEFQYFDSDITEDDSYLCFFVELVPSVRYSDIECNVSKDVIHVDIEKIISAELDISVEFTGDSDSKHFISGAELDNSIVTVSGAQSIINTAGKAVVYIDRSTITKSETLDCKIEVFDRNGTNITKDVKLSQDAVGVNVSVYNTKTIGVDLRLTCADKELEEYISGITLDKENIVIAGPDKELKNIDSLSIDSDIVVSASDIMSGVMLKTVSVSQYLPSTVVAVSGFETLTATVKFVETESVTVDIDYSSIDIHGKAKIEPLQSSVSFSVIAKAGEMPSDVKKNIKVSFDTSGLSVGAQEVKLTTVCNDVRLLNNATLYLNIIKEG